MTEKAKSDRIKELVQNLRGQPINAHYLAYFECFNRQLYFEAHEVLEQLWLPQRTGPDGNFYKGLIQLAGAFVHIQKSRPGPALSLLGLAEKNLSSYPKLHHLLDLEIIFSLIGSWREIIRSKREGAKLILEKAPPQLPFPSTVFPK